MKKLIPVVTALLVLCSSSVFASEQKDAKTHDEKHEKDCEKSKDGKHDEHGSEKKH